MLAFKTLMGGGWMLISRFAGRGIDAITLLILARALTPADFGVAALATALVAVIDMILEVPVTQALVRLQHLDRKHLDTSFTLGLLRGLMISAVIAAAAWPYSHFNKDPSLFYLVLVLATGPVVRSVSSPAMVHFNRNLQFRPVFISELSGKILAFLVALLAVSAGLMYWAIILNTITSAIVTTIASYIIAPYRPRLSLARFSDFASFIGWYNSAQIVSALNWQFDRLLIGTLSTKPELGKYSIAEEMAIFPTKTLIGPALPPVMSAFSQIVGDPDRLRSAFLKATKFVMLISIPVCLGISLTADLVTGILLGPKWEESIMFLRVLVLSVVLVPYTQVLASACYSLDKPQILFRINTFELILRVSLIPLAFSLGSVIGISFARVLIATVLFIYCLKSTKTLLQISFLIQCLNLFKLVIAGAAMVLAVLTLRQSLAPLSLAALEELVIISAIGAAVYLGTLWSLGMRLVVGMKRLEIVDREIFAIRGSSRPG